MKNHRHNQQSNRRDLFATLAIVIFGMVGCGSSVVADVRIKDITTVEGFRINQLTGIGLVTGLNGTGGKSTVTRRMLQNMLQTYGLRSDPNQRLTVLNDTRLRTDNVAVVEIKVNLPVFAKPGQTLDVLVSSIDDSKSLQGGTLMVTPLRGLDGCDYAVASGPVTIGGFSFEGQAAQVQKNHPTTGTIPNGATVEAEVPFEFGELGSFRLLLRNADFQNARQIAEVVNKTYPGTAFAEDAGSVKVLVPTERRLDMVAFVSECQQIRVSPDMAAKVVINERTGTIVFGRNVRISQTAVVHANLAVITTESPEVSQPAPFSDGTTEVVPRTTLEVVEEKRAIQVLEDTVTVADLAAALNALGVTPRDLSSIFQQLKAVGALHAELEMR